MYHIYLAFVIAKQEVQILRSKTSFPTEQACKEHLKGEIEGAKKMAKKIKHVEFKVGLCEPDPVPEDSI